MKCPPTAGSSYFNYKSFPSMNLLDVADANSCFTLIAVGALGCEKDSSVFSNSGFGKAFSSGDLNVPPIRNIAGTAQAQAQVSHCTLKRMWLCPEATTVI
jgi:hypothetical protein